MKNKEKEAKGPGRPKKYTGEYLEELQRKLLAHIENSEIPSLARFALEVGVPRQYLYEISELRSLVKRIAKISGRTNRKKYGYKKYVGSAQVTKYKYAVDPQFRLQVCFSSCLRHSLKLRNIPKNSKTAKILAEKLGYRFAELRKHLEGLFRPGMTWDNYGKWHIDHIKPLTAFNFKSIDDCEFKACWGLNNLRPLWAADNIRKGNTYHEK